MSTHSPFVIDIVVLPQSAPGHALALVELLRTVNLLAGLRGGERAPRLGWRFVQPSGQPLPPETGLLKALVAEGDGGSDAPASALFISPLHLADIPAVRDAVRTHPALSQRVALMVDTGGLVCTLGNAAWFPALCGRLDHSRLALAWYYTAGMARDAPGLRPVVGQGFCEDGAWLSAAYPHDLSQLAIALAHRALGPDAAQALAAVLRPDHDREMAAAQAAHTIPNTRDSTLARAIAWMEQRVEQPYDLAALATAAAVSPRTLLRHFQQELGHSPLDHLHALRCARARVLLEITLESVPTVAQACGYADPAAFRRIFLRHTGFTPSAYRQRHALRAPRRAAAGGWTPVAGLTPRSLRCAAPPKSQELRSPTRIFTGDACTIDTLGACSTHPLGEPHENPRSDPRDDRPARPGRQWSGAGAG